MVAQETKRSKVLRDELEALQTSAQAAAPFVDASGDMQRICARSVQAFKRIRAGEQQRRKMLLSTFVGLDSAAADNDSD